MSPSPLREPWTTTLALLGFRLDSAAWDGSAKLLQVLLNSAVLAPLQKDTKAWSRFSAY